MLATCDAHDHKAEWGQICEGGRRTTDMIVTRIVQTKRGTFWKPFQSA